MRATVGELRERNPDVIEMIKTVMEAETNDHN